MPEARGANISGGLLWVEFEGDDLVFELMDTCCFLWLVSMDPVPLIAELSSDDRP
jgi:hypothetical protein